MGCLHIIVARKWVAMTEFVKSLKRLYWNKKITDTKLKGLLESRKISDEEFKYILRKEGE